MKKELLCPSCGAKLRSNLENKQMVSGDFARFVYGPMRPDVDAQKLQCDGCDEHFKARGDAVCFSNWDREEMPEQWERHYIIEMEAFQL